ncbi:MAG: hypothetical protein ACM3RX_08050 [Methanococcaceae archaeon]
MNKKIRITEEDLYLFIVKSEKLDGEKLQYIQDNIEDYREDIEFLKSFEEPDSQEINDLIDKKYSEFFHSKLLRLFPMKIKKAQESRELTLAASSGAGDVEEPSSESFSDLQSEHLLKIIKIKNERSFYLFTKDNTLIKSFMLKILPSRNLYEISEGKSSIPFDEKRIETIEIQFHKGNPIP